MSVAELYLDTLRVLVKATGNTPPKRSYIRNVNDLQNTYERKALKQTQTTLRTARKRFVSRFKSSKIVPLLSYLAKSSSGSEEDKARTEIRRILEAVYAGADADMVGTLSPLIDDLAKEFKSTYEVDLNFDLIDKRATEYLREHATNYFTTLTDTQADGILKTIADGMSSEDGYTLASLTEKIRSTFGSATMYFDTIAGTREIDATDWAMMVARSETARAASYSQRAINESLGLETWQWLTQETGCDDCDSNDQEIVNIGDDFPSGDTEPPAHTNCRCVVIAVLEELTASQDDNTDETDTTNDTGD